MCVGCKKDNFYSVDFLPQSTYSKFLYLYKALIFASISEYVHSQIQSICKYSVYPVQIVTSKVIIMILTKIKKKYVK